MDKFLRFFIKFHGYCIAVASSILTALFTSIFTSNWAYIRYEEFYNLRYTGIPALVFGLVWMVANSLLFIGIFKEKKTLLYPFCALFLLDLVLVLLRDFYLMIYDSSWYKTVFFNVCLPLMFFIVPYVILSMLALMKLFEVDPIVRTDDNFVRFDRRSNSIDTVTIIN
uniref:(northern house mosquito) hypothetical protein n=1 Tax=Culex pipiens TaxID=7175 RepID=A0A8D8NT32_CULPI